MFYVIFDKQNQHVFPSNYYQGKSSLLIIWEVVIVMWTFITARFHCHHLPYPTYHSPITYISMAPDELTLDHVIPNSDHNWLDWVCLHTYLFKSSLLIGYSGMCLFQFSSFQFNHSAVSDSLQPQGLQHSRLPCPSPTPGAYLNSCPSHLWCHPTIWSFVIPFSSHLQSFPASESFPMSWFFASGGQSIGVAASAWSFQWIFRTDFL